MNSVQVTLRAGLFVTALMAGALPGAPADVVVAQTASKDPRNALVDVLAGGAPSAQALAGRIRTLGSGALPFVLELHRSGRVPASWRRGDLPRRFTPVQAEGLASALIEWFPAVRRDFLEPLSIEGTVEERKEGLELLGQLGSSDDFDLLVQFTTLEPDGRAPIPVSLRKAFGAALGRMGERQVAVAVDLERLFGLVPTPLEAEIVRALESIRTQASLAVLVDLLGRSDELDPLVLATLSRVGSKVGHPIAPDVLAGVHSYLQMASPAELPGVLQAVGALEIHDAIPDVLALLDGADRHLESGALAALRAITGADFGEQAADWWRWYDGELDWWEQEADEAFRTIASGTPAEAVRMLNDVATVRLYRHELARRIAGSLSSLDPVVAVAACRALGQFRSHAVLADLEVCLGREDEVANAARRAWQRITGKDLPGARGGHGAERQAGDRWR